MIKITERTGKIRGHQKVGSVVSKRFQLHSSRIRQIYLKMKETNQVKANPWDICRHIGKQTECLYQDKKLLSRRKEKPADIRK